ncbi:hypothetical protein L226DRAFT_540322 [Lentinus tigrinus ALCF2SS1-7]|uniref:Uncharacterized protein n=1 Tax=Lentinus tigrinus ALCF2SS1-6 TaxID=1328759 RepID=A0A5C2RSD8_9APHY|nr:hypothetical protein L227DRAFT_580994 [Lentinus tigrinus ALCF2SS1-6]RPD68787.1 hypothetical protein L226DRAFT_540322 [Lentinus tigrinus ALCF2SS1-7]
MSVPEVIERGHDPSENWDEDFEFNGNPATSRSDNKPSPSSPRRSNPSTPHSKDRRSSLNNWAEPGPSTPLRQRLQQTENWDDDFQDTESPRPSARRGSFAQAQNGGARVNGGSSSPVENWDDEFEDGTTRNGSSPRKRTPRKRPSWPSSDEEDEFGFADREDDRTVTTRSRGVPFNLPTDIPPPVPPLPSPFPRSPTASVFSVPVSSTTGRDSVAGYSYSSTAHLALRPTVSGSSAAVAARLALLPPSPPIHRERRRLRKKSRPPPNFEEGIFELDDRAELAEQARPVTPEKKTRDVPATSLDDPPADVGNTSTTKTPLLSRIGSVGKKWSAGRKKRASTGPSEVALQERDEASRERQRHQDSDRSRPTSFAASSSPGHSGAKSWFFRGGGGGQGPGSPPSREAPLKHEKSVERLLHLMGVERGREREPESPRSVKSKSLHTRDGTGSSALPEDLEEAVDGNGLPASALLFGGGTPRRPTSMQVSISNGSSGSSWSNRPPVPRHVSYNDSHSRPRRPATPSSRASSKQRSASASVEDVHRAKKSSTATRETCDDHSSDAHSSQPPEKPPLEDQKGSRRFMGGIRRISLVGSKHKRTKSITAEDKEKEKRPKRPGTASSAHETDASHSHDQSTPRPPSRVVRSSHDIPLLPPIELQPPSPPRNKGPRNKPLVLDSANLATPTRSSVDRTLETSRSHPTLHSKSSTQTTTTSTETALATIPSPLPSPTRPRGSTSPVQTASLGRTAQPPKEREGPSSLRRNSLGDLKIPARISQAQVSLRRDLTMVRDFATSVEQLKQLQLTYTTLVVQVRALINDPQESQSRPVSPTFIHFPKPPSRSRANTNPTTKNAPTQSQLNTAFLSIEAKYRLSWECAELLIDLAGGGGNQPTSPPPSSQSAPVVPTTAVDSRKNRERAITLAGDEPKPVVASAPGPTSPPLASPPPSQWRASTGRHDLSQRQLLLLREMLNNPDPSATMSLEPNIPEEEINRNWRWGDAMNSTVTLPSEESESMNGTMVSPTKKQNTARRGMRHIREMLRRLKKNPGQIVVAQSTSSVSASTDSSLNLPRESRPQSVMSSRRRAKTSTGPESIASRHHPNSPYGTTPGLSHKSSPRRPSLASIFRLGQKSSSKTTNASVDDFSSNTTGLPSSGSGHASGTSTSLGDDEEDWDRIESTSDLDHAARALGFTSDGTATVRGKKGKSPYLFQSRTSDAETARRPPDASLSSLFAPSESPKKPASAIPPSILENYTRSIKLSDVREADTGDEGGPSQSHNSSGQSTRAPSRNKKRQSAPSPSPRRPPSRNRKNPTGSVRSAPPQPWGNPSPELSSGALPLPDLKLAMAPENIKPLLENAREVHARCTDCIAELEALLGSGASVAA